MTVTLSADVSATEVDDGIVLLDQRKGSYWHLNGTGAAALRLLLDGNSPQETAARIAERFHCAADRALTDVEALLGAVRKARLVVGS
jgi:coenzyme PQQ synthesis protein D (PqqD)